MQEVLFFQNYLRYSAQGNHGMHGIIAWVISRVPFVSELEQIIFHGSSLQPRPGSFVDDVINFITALLPAGQSGLPLYTRVCTHEHFAFAQNGTSF